MTASLCKPFILKEQERTECCKSTRRVLYRTCFHCFCNFLLSDPLLNTEVGVWEYTWHEEEGRIHGGKSYSDSMGPKYCFDYWHGYQKESDMVFSEACSENQTISADLIWRYCVQSSPLTAILKCKRLPNYFLDSQSSYCVICTL